MPMRIVEIDAADATPAEATVIVGDALAGAIAAGGAFQALVRMPRATDRARGPQATRAVRLLLRIRPGLSRSCAGIAFIADAATRAVHGRADAAQARLWGCPVTTVADEAAAREWLATTARGVGR